MKFLFQNINEVHFEVTDKCNLKCDYCYAEVSTIGHEKFNFNQEYIISVIEKIAFYSNFELITVTFHGGEPLLLDLDWYKKVLSRIDEIFFVYKKKYTISMQSNLVLLNQQYIDLFSQYKLMIGTSIDGPAMVHNQLRSSYDKTVKYIPKLEKEKIFGGAITVVSVHNWDKVEEIYDNFLDLGINSFHINIVSSVGLGMENERLSIEQILCAYIDSYKSMIKHNFKIVDTRTLQKLKRFYLEPSFEELSSNLKCDNPICHAGIYMININSKGEIYPCGTAGTSGNNKNFLLTTIENLENYTEEQHNSNILKFHQKSSKYYDECQYCRAKFICEHGCPAFDVNDNITEQNRCEATKLFYDFLKEQNNHNFFSDIIKRTK